MTHAKTILVSNDDGINSPGISVLCQYLAQEPSIIDLTKSTINLDYATFHYRIICMH